MKYCLLLVGFLNVFFGANAQCPTLIISEYVEGSSTNKALEFTNVGDTPIMLDAFEVLFFNNGSATASRTYNFPKYELASAAVFTIVYPNATLFTKYDTTYAFNFNGDDAIQLIYKPTGQVLDAIGEVGVDPGDGWTVDSVENATLDHVLVRKSNQKEGAVDWSIGKDTWIVLGIDDTSDFGKHEIEWLVECISIVDEQVCQELLFSEYIEGSSQNKALEITNVTNGTVRLKGFRIEQLNNGALTASRTLNLPDKSLLSGETYTMAHPSISLVDTSQIDTLFSFNFNGDDVLLLINGNTKDTVDVIGKRGVDPGESWTISGDSTATSNHTLIRKSEINTGTKDWLLGMSQWQIYEEDYNLDFGKHTVDVMNTCVVTSIKEEAVVPRKIKTIFTLQGKELQELQYNTLLILHYEDGSFEKVYYVE